MGAAGHGCFDGDLGDMPLEARKVAIKLKNGRPITAVSGQDYEQLLEHLTDISRSLNNDLLKLYLDEANKVAWAECVPDADETSLLIRSRIRQNDLGLFIVLAQLVDEERTGGEEDSLGWYELRSEVRTRYLSLNPRFRKETRGSLVEQGFAKALERAEKNHWIELVDEERMLVLPTVAALLDRGVVSEAIEACTSDEAAAVAVEEEDD